ncbi:ATP-binding protein [Pseudoxanthomonas broegbernensis]|uniref:ATP-binding protein n=1 Tax=Pseudoxanthomonas broegbernensis TaxID=83619 RepID=A0A7V8GM85_9GAMM|nr:ATP-binding protein [Pseudoxanthomonas broegbernensis]KAF1686323.1 ATP-binding protein [Pseudoxanthomonas broegbernensis]MBB6064010.1 signal transduction histidine kinase [Pseudoxanthomonas broegbernensis]
MKRWLQRLRPPRPAASEAHLADLQRQLDIARAVEAERRRIHDDLHDDVGSQLLTLLHRVPPAEQQRVREILQDLRAILARERGVEGTLLEVLAQLREEAEQRLQTRGIDLDWQQADELPDPALDPAQAMHLFRIGRESITNALRHAHPHALRVVVDVAGDQLVFEVTDDGRFDPARIGHGRGTRSMQARASQLHGDISWQAGTLGGTKVRLRFPLPGGDTPASTGWANAAAPGNIAQ